MTRASLQALLAGCLLAAGAAVWSCNGGSNGAAESRRPTAEVAPAATEAGPAATEAGPAATEAGPAAAGTATPGEADEPIRTSEKPIENVLLITVDTLRADALGFTGNDRVKTPLLDRFAAAGRVFSEAHAQNVVTLPSHTNILTGLYPYQHGVRDNGGFVLRDDVPTVATRLHDVGFATAAVVGAFPLDGRFGLDRGFDLYDDQYGEGAEENQFRELERPGNEVVARGKAWWDAHRNRKRFLWIHLYDPHAPYAPPEPYASRYASEPYLGEVAAVDHDLTPLLQPFLDGKEGATLIVFTGDHGEALGDHGETTHSLFTYEATLHIPLVLWGPDVRSGTSTGLVRHIDILPTVLDAAGLPVPADLPGRSLLGPAPKSPEAGASYFEALSANMSRGWAPLRGVIAGGYKLIALPVPELYDLEADPGETNNLFDKDRRRARRLADLLPKESVWPPPAGALSGKEAAALQSLGYLAGSADHKTHYTAADDPKNLVGIDRDFHHFIDLYQANKLKEATALIEKIVAARPDMGIAYNYYAQVLLQQGLDRQALKVLQDAHDRHVSTASADRQLGLLLAELGNPREAIIVLQPLAATGDPDALNAMGVALTTGGLQDEARAAFEQVFKQDPRNPVAHQNLALVALRTQHWEDARSEARKALALNDQLPRAWNYLGVALYNLGQVHDSLDAWDRAVALQPRNADLLFNLGLVAAEAGETSRARKALEQFVAVADPAQYGPDLAKARATLARLGQRSSE